MEVVLELVKRFGIAVRDLAMVAFLNPSLVTQVAEVPFESDLAQLSSLNIFRRGQYESDLGLHFLKLFHRANTTRASDTTVLKAPLLESIA